MQAVRLALAARFPGMEPGQIAEQVAPPLKVELSRLKYFDRDLTRARMGDRTVKLIGPAELDKLERLAALGRPGAPRPG